jgi:hypothetical protein
MKKKMFIFRLPPVLFVSLTNGTDVCEPSKPRTGDAASFDYLVTGDYLKSGIPYSCLHFFLGGSQDRRRIFAKIAPAMGSLVLPR